MLHKISRKITNYYDNKIIILSLSGFNDTFLVDDFLISIFKSFGTKFCFLLRKI